MFEDLKARRTGRSAKESARLWVTLSAAIACGAFIFGGRACASAPAVTPRPVVNDGSDAPVTRALDMRPIERLRTAPADPAAFDTKALDHLIVEIRSGSLRRAPDRRIDLDAVAALDPAVAVGSLVETTGTVVGLDAEEYRSTGVPTVDQLWGFALDGEPGVDGTPPARILVVHPSATTDPDAGRPADASRADGAREPLSAGMRIRVRGYWLQRRTGSVGGVKGVERPTVLLVGREYRITFPELPAISSPEAASLELVKDRRRADTLTLNDQAIYELLVWARNRGATSLADDLRSGRLGSTFWGSARFLNWGHQVGADFDQTLDDPRSATLEARGKVFETTGVLADQLHEDWEHVPKNLYGVDERWKYWFLSDFYANAPFLVDSPFPLSDFPGIRDPGTGRHQRVKMFGVFVKVHSFEPRNSHKRRDREKNPVVTVPYFVLLHLESDENNYVSTPLLQNPFFWTGVSLAVFLAGFFLIMTRMERKESAALRAHRIRLRKGVRLPSKADLDRSRAESSGSGGGSGDQGPVDDGGGGGGGGSSPDTRPAPPPASPPST